MSNVEFPSTLSPVTSTRAGRMLEQGDVRVTVTSHDTGRHITIRFKAFKDTRNVPGKNWTRVPLAEATHVFVEVPAADGDWADKVGTFYPDGGRWYTDRSADAARIYAASIAAHWLNGAQIGAPVDIAEEERCGVCARRLTDPVSIERGIGPECYGNITGSQHQVKNEEGPAADEPDASEIMQPSLEEAMEQQGATVEEMIEGTRLAERASAEERVIANLSLSQICEALPNLSITDLHQVARYAETIAKDKGKEQLESGRAGLRR